MSIPKGYKLVPVEPTKEMREAIYGLLSAYDDGSDITPSFFMKMLINATPTPPQPIYDEAKERELFEAFYSERAKTLPLPLGNPIRYGGGQYVNDFALFGWMVWLACAQSRAKAGEVV